MRISVLSKEYITITVTANVNVLDDTVAWAFTDPGVDPASWTVGDWDASGRARILVGPGGAVTLTEGLKDVWLKITDSPEVPVRRVGQINVY